MKEILLERGGNIVSNDKNVALIAKSLGSTLAVIVTDTENSISGICQCILPKSVRRDSSLKDVLEQLRLLFKQMIKLGSKTQNIRIMLCGAATYLEEPPDTALGVMLYKRVLAVLKQSDMKISGEHVGGPINRSVSIRVGDEKAKVLLPDNKEILI